MLYLNKIQEMLEWNANFTQISETEVMLASIEWQLGSMRSVRNFSLIFLVLLPPYACLFSLAVTCDAKISHSHYNPKKGFTDVKLNCY